MCYFILLSIDLDQTNISQHSHDVFAIFYQACINRTINSMLSMQEQSHKSNNQTLEPLGRNTIDEPTTSLPYIQVELNFFRRGALKHVPPWREKDMSLVIPNDDPYRGFFYRLNILPPSSNVSHFMIQNLSSNISHSKMSVDPIILIVHRFWVFPDKKMCMQLCRGRYMWGRCMGKCILI